MASKSLDSVLKNVEKEIIIDALKSTRGNIAVAARLLGTTERILGLRIKKYGFTPQKYRGKADALIDNAHPETNVSGLRSA